MTGRRIYIVTDRGVGFEAYSNMEKVLERYPFVCYETFRKYMRKEGYWVKGRYEFHCVSVQ